MPAVAVPNRTLKSGDRMTRTEFHELYAAAPPVTRAELIDGVVHMPMADNTEEHGEPHSDFDWVFVQYRIFTPGVRVSNNSSVFLDMDNEPQPDLSVFITPEAGGQVAMNGGYIEGSPELVAEVSASTAALDLGAKFRAYQRNGVLEYVVWQTRTRTLRWFINRNGSFQPLPPDADGVLRSLAFPGLWIDAAALERRDMLAVHTALARGLAAPEHAEFAARLKAKLA